MDDFRTILKVTPSPFKLELRDKVFTIGSCFSDNLGNLLQDHKFETLVNPFSTVYNPLSIHKALQYAIHASMPVADTFGQLNGTFFNYDFHSSFSSLTASAVEKSVQNTIQRSHLFLRQSSVVFITYGTSWIYERTDNGDVVSNCHKVAAKNFRKSLLTQKKIIESFEELMKDLLEFNPNIKVILTVSPVRHLKDTLELNAVSKSILRLACHTLSELYPQVEYFPAYEIVLDDLRDYRFYDRDLLHPSPAAIDYIWEKFQERYFTSETRGFVHEWSEIRKGLAHKAFQPSSKAHQAFLQQLLSRLKELKGMVNVDKEIAQVEKQLI
ncbi:MAG: GSCFA domain-containing protein [Cyclobacteriaceae bacterium]